MTVTVSPFQLSSCHITYPFCDSSGLAPQATSATPSTTIDVLRLRVEAAILTVQLAPL